MPFKFLHSTFVNFIVASSAKSWREQFVRPHDLNDYLHTFFFFFKIRHSSLFFKLPLVELKFKFLLQNYFVELSFSFKTTSCSMKTEWKRFPVRRSSNANA